MRSGPNRAVLDKAQTIRIDWPRFVTVLSQDLASCWIWGWQMMSAQPKQDLVERAKERYKRSKRLEWSIQTWEGRGEDVYRMIGILKEALAETRKDLEELERMLGYKVKDKQIEKEYKEEKKYE